MLIILAHNYYLGGFKYIEEMDNEKLLLLFYKPYNNFNHGYISKEYILLLY